MTAGERLAERDLIQSMLTMVSLQRLNPQGDYWSRNVVNKSSNVPDPVLTAQGLSYKQSALYRHALGSLIVFIRRSLISSSPDRLYNSYLPSFFHLLYSKNLINGCQYNCTVCLRTTPSCVALYNSIFKQWSGENSSHSSLRQDFRY